MNPKKHKVVKAHTRYELKDGTYIPGNTTICNLLNKPQLIRWANRLGLEGIDSTKYVDELASIGTLAHELISIELAGKTVPINFYDDYTPQQIECSNPCVGKFREWKKNNKLKPILIETGLVSEKYRFGGTLDLYCELNGKKCLLDWKTGSGLYEAHKIQLSANRALLIENGHEVDECRLLGIGRNEAEDTKDVIVGGMDLRFEKFLCLLKIYQIDKYKLKV